MTKLFLTHFDVLATMDGDGVDKSREIHDGALIIEDNVILHVGTHDELAPLVEGMAGGCEIHDMTGHIAIPGMVNTHHHLFQNLTRLIPEAQNESLFGWLQTLYPIWMNLEPDDFYISAALGLAELALSGCTTSSDHQYIYPNGTTLENAIAAADDVGMRFTATRGSMSIGESNGGLPPDALTENENMMPAAIRCFISPLPLVHLSL